MATPLTSHVYKISTTGKAEDAERYTSGGFHPVHIGDTLKNERYRILHKLGFGGISTVWLARDTIKSIYVSLKIARADCDLQNSEIAILQDLARRDDKHNGRQYIMELLDDFIIHGPNGSHQCFVTRPGGRRLVRPTGVSHTHLTPARLLAAQLFEAVDYLHTCNIGHGDLYTGNIIMQLGSFDAWSEDRLYACLGHPVLERIERQDGKPLERCAPAYTVHPADLSHLEAHKLLHKVMIIDFGQAFYLNSPPAFTITPKQYSAPENLFRQGVSRPRDIWALGCGTFEICAGYTLFKALFSVPQDVLRDMVALLGKLPNRFWDAWPERRLYFDDDGKAIQASEHSIVTQPYSLFERIRDMAILYPEDGGTPDMNLRESMTTLPTPELALMYDFLSKIFVLDPNTRISAREALLHPFLASIDVSEL